MTPEPLLCSRPCPESAMPSAVRSAVRKAEKYGWACTVTIAIGPVPDAVRSVQLVAHKGAARLMSRHEGDTNGAKMAFAQAYATSQIHRGIFPLGWNEFTAALENDGVPPRPKLTSRSRTELNAARVAVSDQIPGAVAVAVVDPRPLCKSMVEPGVRCNRPAEEHSSLCAGPCSTETDW